MTKKIAVIVRNRQGEALRMAIGLILLDDRIDIYVLDRKIEDTEQNRLNLETIRDLELNAYTNEPANSSMAYLSLEEISRKIVDYDHVLAY
ncbi:MAG: hypothetical protein ACYC9M_06570 [Desulfobulbaceae bacterium]